jgi:hypothetical protein
MGVTGKLGQIKQVITEDAGVGDVVIPKLATKLLLDVEKNYPRLLEEFNERLSDVKTGKNNKKCR